MNNFFGPPESLCTKSERLSVAACLALGLKGMICTVDK